MAIGDITKLLNTPFPWQGGHVTDAEQYMQAAQVNMNDQLYNRMMAQQAQAQNIPQTNVSPSPHDRARSLFLARLGGIKVRTGSSQDSSGAI
jgi:hypothetical protein